MDDGRTDRIQRALVSLAGLSVGDSFGERFFGPPGHAQSLLAQRKVPPPKWAYTDDTVMALSVVESLIDHGRIEQDRLAQMFTGRWADEPRRGYGAGAHKILSAIAEGSHWTVAATVPFGPSGSFGNGGAMRSPPIGAYFCDDIPRVVAESSLSAEVTHLHIDGKAGAIAAALAAAYETRSVVEPGADTGISLFDLVLQHLPQCETRAGIELASTLGDSVSVEEAARRLGTGASVSSQDTVPFCLWIVANHRRSFEETLWTTVAGLGDRDTTCAIVGGIVATKFGLAGIPERWMLSRESLPLKFKPRVTASP